MDEIASIPVTLPRANPTVSYWPDPPDPIVDMRTTTEPPRSADLVMIVSGITRASIAFDYLQRDPLMW
jgi:hypothetical protein